MDEKLKQTLTEAVAAIAEACGVSEEEAAEFVKSGISIISESGLPQDQQISAILQVCKTVVSKGNTLANYVKAGAKGFTSVLQALMKPKKRNGGTINAFTPDINICPAGYEMVQYRKKGGKVCRRCQKMNNGGVSPDIPSQSASFHQPYLAADDMMERSIIGDPYYDSRKDAYKSLLKFIGTEFDATASPWPSSWPTSSETPRRESDNTTTPSSKKKGGILDFLGVDDKVFDMWDEFDEPKGKGNVDINKVIESGPGWRKQTVIKKYRG